MSLEAKLVVVAVVLAITVPLVARVLRGMRRGERFRKPKMGDMQMPPPSGPSLD